MAIKKPTPKTLSADVAQSVMMASANQDVSSSRVTSWDPQNFPVFDVPVNTKVLIYIPNHQVQQPDGSMGLRMDKFPAHPIIDGRTFGNVRCINGLVNDDPQLNWDGTCPLCDALSEVWDLYGKQYADVARSKGIATDAPEAQEALKADRTELVRNRVIKEAEVWYTFPIVVIKCQANADGTMTTNPELTPDGKLQGTPMWYSIRERSFEEKWVAGYDSIEGETPTSPAGYWAVLNFTYTPKSGKHDKMGSARALKVTYRTMQQYGEWATYYDKLTEDWTPYQATQTVVLDTIRSKEETQEVTDQVMKPVRDKLALYSLSQANAVAPAPAVGGATSADSILQNFGGGTQVESPSAPAGIPSADASQAQGVPSGAPVGAAPTQGVPTGAPVGAAPSQEAAPQGAAPAQGAAPQGAAPAPAQTLMGEMPSAGIQQ